MQVFRRLIVCSFSNRLICKLQCCAGMTSTMAMSARSDLELGARQLSSTYSCRPRLLKTLEAQQGYAATSPSQLLMCPEKRKTYKTGCREKLICYSQTQVVEFESNKKSSVADTNDLKLFGNSTALPLVEFKMSDFELCTNVSVGLAGRVWLLTWDLSSACVDSI